MRVDRLAWSVFLIAAVWAAIWSLPKAHAATTVSTGVTISATVAEIHPVVPNPTVQFTGLASPTAVVTIARDASIVGTATASTTGVFSSLLVDQPVGQVVYTVSAVDVHGAALAPISFALNLTAGTNTIVSGVFLGPSIAIDRDSVKLGQYVTLSGSTAPSSAVTLEVHSVSAESYALTADASGAWSKMVNTADLGVGTHIANARSVYAGSQVSSESATVVFAVNPLEACDGKKTADLNCDSKVNITDFSILLYFWLQTTPSNSRADINADGKVDVVDFSILLYQWT